MAPLSLFLPGGVARHVALARRDQIERVCDGVRDGRDVVLVGGRGVGKTSVLRAVEQELSGYGYRPAAVRLHEDDSRDALRASLAAAFEHGGELLLVTVDDIDETTAPLAELVAHEAMAHAPHARIVYATRDAERARASARLRLGHRGPAVVELPWLDRDELRAALLEAFEDVGRAPGDTVDRLLDVTQGHPLTTMLLARHLWDAAGEGAAPQQAWADVSQLTEELDGVFEAAWESHAGAADRQVVRALADGRRSLFSAETLRDYGLSKSSAARARDRLVRQGHVHRALDGSVALANPLYARWVAERQHATAPHDDAPERATSFDIAAPLGTPDGARSDITETLTAFVPIVFPRGNAAGFDNPESMRTRVIVGRKGAGKTLYIRRFQAAAAAQDAIYADIVSTTMPATSDVVRLGQSYAPHERTSVWTQAWRAAILRSTASHLLTARHVSGYVASAERERLERTYAELGGRTTVPREIGAELKDIMIAGPRARLDRYLSHRSWDDLSYQLSEALSEAPPIAFYLDSIDEDYAHAPDHWLACQKGLFYAVMRLLRDPQLGGRLHVVITIRDSVYGSILAGEHATRYRSDPHIQALAWDEPRIRHFLDAKLRRLPRDFMTHPDAGSSVEAWLGAHPALARGTPDGLTGYLLRHTRLLPRDVILLGNALCDRVADARREGRQIATEEVRATVVDVARWFGREQLAITANHLTAQLMPPGASDGGFSEIYIGQDASASAYRSSVERILADALRPLAGRTVKRAELLTLETDVARQLGDGARVLAALWQNGLLGACDDHGRTVFQHTYDAEGAQLPERSDGYVLHPVLAAVLEGRGA